MSRRIQLVLSMWLFAGCQTTAAATHAPRQEDTMEIKQLLQQYEQALNQSDAQAVMALYGEAPVFMPQHAPAMVGREAVRAAYDHVFATIRLAVRFEVHEIEVLGAQAWVRTSSAGQQTLLATKQVREEGNNELFVLRREGAAWRIHRYLFATSRPPGP